MKVADVMTSPVLTVKPDASIADLLELLQSRNISGLPVVDDKGSLAGIVSRQDIVMQELRLLKGRPARTASLDQILNGGFVTVSAEGLKSRSTAVGEIMTPASRIRSCTPDASLREACALMSSNHVHRLPVLRRGKLVGILTTTDVVRAVAEGRL